MQDSESLSSIDAALELGVNFIDTSDAYGAGYSETLLGKALKGRRDKVILATKGGNELVGNTPAEFAAVIRNEIDQYGKLIKAAGITPE